MLLDRRTAIAAIQTALRDAGFYTGAIDSDFGPKSRTALDALLASPMGDSLAGTLGDGTWPWTARIDGKDVFVKNARMTCFGGSRDPQDNGDTASGISTKLHPDLAAVSLPMDGRKFPNLTRIEHRALDGSPIPRVPWQTLVRVELTDGRTFDWPVIDLGPGKRTGNALDLTVAAARLIDPHASATNFEVRCDYRILDAAQYVRP